MITGSAYLLRGQLVRVTCQWHGKSNPDLPRLQALLPLVRLKATAPRNVEIEFPGGVRQVRGFRGLRKPPGPVPTAVQLVLGDCGDGYGSAPPVRGIETVPVAGGVL